MAKRRPGVIRDAIVSYLSEVERDASVGEITQAVEAELGQTVAPSSVRSYLRLGDDLLTRTARGRPARGTAAGGHRRWGRDVWGSRGGVGAGRRVRLGVPVPGRLPRLAGDPRAQQRPRRGDGPALARRVQRQGAGEAAGREGRRVATAAVVRRTRAFAGASLHRALRPRPRAAGVVLPGVALYPVLVPGANVLVASNPLVSYRVASVVTAGFERRGEIVG